MKTEVITDMKKIVYFIFSACVIQSCNNASQKEKPITGKDTGSRNYYGSIGADTVFQFSLVNNKGMKVAILNYGGTVTDILVPDKKGKNADVVLGFESLAGYLQKANPYFGCLVGRYANRIANAQFILDGKSFVLDTNDHGNMLHGGFSGFDKKIWTVAGFSDSSLSLAYHSKDSEGGFPGNLQAEVRYTLTGNNELKIEYTETTDKPTPVNLTNHCYFNLSGADDSTILDHELMLRANQFTPVNDKLIPTGKIADVKGTAMDFTTPKKVGKDISKVKGGYDFNWVLTKSGTTPELAATLFHAPSGRYMEVYTTEPGIQFYSGNFLDATLAATKGAVKYVQHAGLCLEAQHFPDSPNEPAFPNTILKPGETYHQTTIYKFSTK